MRLFIICSEKQHLQRPIIQPTTITEMIDQPRTNGDEVNKTANFEKPQSITDHSNQINAGSHSESQNGIQISQLEQIAPGFQLSGNVSFLNSSTDIIIQGNY